MSSISSTQSGLGLAQFLQSIAGNTTAASSNSSSGTVGSSSTAPAQSGHHRQHGAAFDKLANAITNALQSVSSTGTGTSTSSTDPNQTITQALEKIFKNGSLGTFSDPDDDTSTTATTTPVSNNATPTPSTSSTSTPSSSLPASFVQTLQSFGVTAQQFQTDFTNALKNAQESGSVDVSSVFKNFPVGSVVDSLG
jgi:hypothetical protein